MSVHQATLQALIEMGIDAPLARAAAQRFENADAAVNWCFGDGANWTPEDDIRSSRPVPPPPSSAPPPPDITLPGTTVEHREVAQNQSDTSSTHTVLDPRSPPLPPRSRPSPSPDRQTPMPLGDKNPFRNSLKPDSNNPFLQSTSTAPPADAAAVGEDGELAKAVALSKGQEMDVDTNNDADNEEDKWDLAARKVRTSGPPPSPTLEAQEAKTTTFGPSTKTDTEGSMAVAPFDWDKQFPQQNTSPQRSKEDEEMEKAIADSLMTASFHSAASAPREEDLPTQVSRGPETPFVLYSHSGRTAFSNLLQGLLAIPRFREVVLETQYPQDSEANRGKKELSDSFGGEAHRSAIIEQLRRLAVASGDCEISFIDADRCIKAIDPNGNGKQLPPIAPTRDFSVRLTEAIDGALGLHGEIYCSMGEVNNLPQPLELFSSQVSTTPAPATFVTFFRDEHSHDIHSHMSRVLWKSESNGTICQLPDILTVFLGWQPSAKREVWKLDKEVIMDRYLEKNAAWAVNIRAKQSLADGNARRLREKIGALTTHNGNDVSTTLINTIKYYEAYPGKDDVEIQHRSELSAKLRQVHDKLQAKVAELKEQLEAFEDEVNGSLFETDDPALNQHVYRLRAVLYHDGALLGTRHLYMYLLGDSDQWWRIQEHEAIKVDWSDVASDSTGMYMDGGAYCLLYERTSPRPEPYGSQESAQEVSQSRVGDDSDGITHVPDVSASQASTLAPSAPPESQVPTDGATSQPAPTAPTQIDLLGDEPDMTIPSQPKVSDHHRPLPKPPVQAAHPEQGRIEERKAEAGDDVTMT